MGGGNGAKEMKLEGWQQSRLWGMVHIYIYCSLHIIKVFIVQIRTVKKYLFMKKKHSK